MLLVAVLALAAPADAQAPTIDQRVTVLEQQVRELDDRLKFLEGCFMGQGALPVQMRATKRPYIVVGVEQDRRARYWLALVDAKCLR